MMILKEYIYLPEEEKRREQMTVMTVMVMALFRSVVVVDESGRKGKTIVGKENLSARKKEHERRR